MELEESIMLHEGLRLKPYKDSVGKTTIGYGRNLEDVGINECEAYHLLQEDISRAIFAARQFGWVQKLDKSRDDVIVEMVFNMGLPKVLGFRKMIQALREDDYEEAADQMLDSKWATQVGQRAITLADKMRGKQQ